MRLPLPPTVLIITISLFENTKGESGHLTLTDKLAIKTPQLSKRESSRYFTNHRNNENFLSCSNNSDCPTWFICDNNTSECYCGPRYDNAIMCNKSTMLLAVFECYCITEVNGRTYAGKCFYNCRRHTLEDKHTSIYHTISDKKDLNEDMCGHFHRTGISCGKCKPGLSPFVLSYKLSCVKCPDSHKNWWKFSLIGFVPLTCLYFIAIFFNINVTSSRLHGYVLFSQALSTPAYVRVLFIAVEDIPWLLNALKALEPFFSLWNLDPFRSIFPDTCLNVDTLTTFALEASVALYPLVLVIVSYYLIELYDRNIHCIVFIWKPFRFIFHLFRDNWDIRTSVIDSFATFFLLSYVKILSVSTDLMVFTGVHELQTNKTHYRVYYDANMEFFRGSHVPYALLAATMAILFVIIPTLILILYPFHCFQKCLSYYQIRWHFLHAFVDSFQGCYKDGTEPGTYDLRWLSSYGLVLLLSMCIIFNLTLSATYFIYALLLILIVIILLVNFQPYKSLVSHYTTIDITFLILLSLHYTSILGVNIAIRKGQKYLYLMFILACVSAFMPIIYLIFITLQWMYLNRKWSGRLLTRVRTMLTNNNGS